jgi:DNA-directed RNA polymerase subunit beta'
VGRLIPAGTGLTYHAERKRQREEERAGINKDAVTADDIEQALSEALSAQDAD